LDVGRWLSLFDYKYLVTGLTQTFALSGTADRFSLLVDRVLDRAQVSKTSLEAGYELRMCR
jgi:hypothetical protein